MIVKDNKNKYMLTLEKPIFIENRFIYPFFNKSIQIKLEKAITWLKNQEIKSYETKIFISDIDFKFLIIDFLENNIRINNKLLFKYDTSVSINIVDAVNSCFVENIEDTNLFIHYYLRMFSTESYYIEAFGKNLCDKEKLNCDFIYEILCEWSRAISNYL